MTHKISLIYKYNKITVTSKSCSFLKKEKRERKKRQTLNVYINEYFREYFDISNTRGSPNSILQYLSNSIVARDDDRQRFYRNRNRWNWRHTIHRENRLAVRHILMKYLNSVIYRRVASSELCSPIKHWQRARCHRSVSARQ